MVKPAQFSKIAMAALVGSVVLFSHTESASAFTTNDHLGRLTTRDNNDYWRAKGKPGYGASPGANQLCQWKFGNNNVWGQGISYSWDTNCYRWKWFWQ